MESENLRNDNIQTISNPRENQKKYLFLMAAVFVVFVVGIILFILGVFKREGTKEAENELSAMTPPKAKAKELEVEKYGSNFSKSMNEKSSEDMENLSAFTDKEVKYSYRSNENLSDEDYAAVRTTSSTNPQYSPKLQRTTKQKLDTKFQTANQRQHRLNNYYARDDTPLYRKSSEELRQERLDLEEKELNQKTAGLVLNNLEKLNSNERITGSSNGQILPLSPKSNKDVIPEKVTMNENPGQLIPEIAHNTIGKKFKRVGFYSETTSLKRRSFSENENIPAVVHGDSEGSVVINGSTLKIRLLENTIFKIGEERIMLPKSTLFTGIVAINGDRLMISVSNLRLGNSIYPVSIQAFDIDGGMGLNIPNAQGKALLDKTLTNVASRPLSGTQIFVPSGGIGRQVGTQLALQGAQSAMQGVQNFARARRANQKILIKPNYKILLKTVNFENLETPDSINDL
jgi:conjugative transposon TraM protein